MTGPNPTDRGKNGSKIHVICDRASLPLSVGISGADVHDSQALVPLMRGIPPIRDFDHLHNWAAAQADRAPLRRRGVETSGRLGRHRWVVERTMSCLNGCHRLHRRYERKAEHFLAFVGIAGALICYRHYTNCDDRLLVCRRPARSDRKLGC